MSFASLGLSTPILNAITDMGYSDPSPIQAQAIPAVLEGRDVMAAAQTGTGKTAAFGLPMLQLLNGGRRPAAGHIRALILTPTRELAAQIAENITLFSKNLRLRHAVAFGGVSINPQMLALRRGVDIQVATPGRLLDLYQQNAIKFDQLEMLVLDEADRMLDMGFIHDIKRILALLPSKRQNLLFSATFSDDIRALAKGLVNNPVEVSVTPPNSTAERVSQTLYAVNKEQKTAALIKLIQTNQWQQVLVFSRTKHGANRLAKKLESTNIQAAAIHGNKSQGARTKALADFKSGAVKVLVATDIAARGLDIDQLPQVVNFELPNVAEDYVHRIGRTGRAGASGHAVSLVSDEELKQLNDIENLLRRHIPRAQLEGFEPSTPLPETRLRANGPKKPKKPKKPKVVSDENKGHGAKPAAAAHSIPTTSNNKGQQRRPGRANDANKGNASRDGNKPSGKANNGNRRPNNQQGRPSSQGRNSSGQRRDNSQR
ncbi:RNA helicase [Shewanella mangrovi]|uniref:ATP-dependent RNA helicase RhlE n=1 Tax=Shewanella mangrovi TaxID=1515746 RepID=A0A094K2Z5_9GAMM|nr:DEAD/DEAH box helicase [Shewanella mangrovi]KFZ39061.1 RNA helicase [Shewanella mangrovi]